jgi:glycerol-3-phosphate O-acyltransferase/dihydroxyacetone phosphate acyltransferase
MNQPNRPKGFYLAMRGLIGLALGFYFRRIERFNVQHVPQTGPVLFTSNHPNSLTDSFVIGAAVPRKVNFVATVQLFRFPPLKWLLTQCGVIPINRVKDDSKAMRTVAQTFEACYRVLESGEAVGIFPEGITYDDSQLKEIKSGAARMALELEHRHAGKLRLQILPVGLTFSAKEVYRSDALINFGQPICVAPYLEGYAEHRKE